MRIGFFVLGIGRDRICKKALQSRRIGAPFCKYGRAIHAASAAYSYPSRSLPDLVFSCIAFKTLQESTLFTKIFYTFYLPIQNK